MIWAWTTAPDHRYMTLPALFCQGQKHLTANHTRAAIMSTPDRQNDISGKLYAPSQTEGTTGWCNQTIPSGRSSTFGALTNARRHIQAQRIEGTAGRPLTMSFKDACVPASNGSNVSGCLCTGLWRRICRGKLERSMTASRRHHEEHEEFTRFNKACMGHVGHAEVPDALMIMQVGIEYL